MDAQLKSKILEWLRENYRIKIAQPDDYYLWHKDTPQNDGVNYQHDLPDAIQDHFDGVDWNEGRDVAEEWALSHLDEEE